MTTQQIQEAQHYLNRIQELDKEITEISKKAEIIVAGNVKCDFSMSVKATTPAPEKAVINEDGDVVLQNGGVSFDIDFSDSMRQSMFAAFKMPHSLVYPRTADPDKISQELTDNTALRILGILIEDKLRRKQELIRSLKELNVEYS